MIDLQHKVNQDDLDQHLQQLHQDINLIENENNMKGMTS
jgi:hypothetical protein